MPELKRGHSEMEAAGTDARVAATERRGGVSPARARPGLQRAQALFALSGSVTVTI